MVEDPCRNFRLVSLNSVTPGSILQKPNGSMSFFCKLEAVNSGLLELGNIWRKLNSSLRGSSSGVQRPDNSLCEGKRLDGFHVDRKFDPRLLEGGNQSNGIKHSSGDRSEDAAVALSGDTNDNEIQVECRGRPSMNVEPSTSKVEGLLDDYHSGRCSTSSSHVTISLPDSPTTASPSGFGRSKTVSFRPSENLEEEMLGNDTLVYSRSKTERGMDKRPSEDVCCNFSPAEKLSERKKKKIIKNMVTIQNDGTVEVHVDQSAEITPKLFDLDVADLEAEKGEIGEPEEAKPIQPLNIAMLIVGTRGDVQPFVAIGKRLQESGHRVRLATHEDFREFVISNGLEFYPLGGDPKILAGYMVKNKGFLPSGPSEISIQRKELKAIINSLLPACIERDGDLGPPFRAEAIISNPPACGHVHVAEYLGVPLHIFFTMPWTPTNEFPHPLARVKQQAAYRLSYAVVNLLMWWGMRDLINEFRMKKLHLRPITYYQPSISHLPTGYIWSPHLVPKPKDWGPLVDVVGFCFLDLAASYRPPVELVEWLQAGEKPIYVGFGSLPVEDPGRMTEIVTQALQDTGQRGIIDKGWGGLGNLSETPNFVYLLENCPHDWLFPQCAAVVHHGGAGTTAAGLKAGCPTTIVPFFGDQPFWGEQVHARGVGPQPIPVQLFSLERLVQAITFMLDPEVKQRALELANQMGKEDGIAGAVHAFHKHWPRALPKLASVHEPPNLLHTILFYLQKMSCLSCFT